MKDLETKLRSNIKWDGLLLDEAANEIARQRKALETLAKYFTSGNLIRVDQATIKSDDFWRITGMQVPNASNERPASAGRSIK